MHCKKIHIMMYCRISGHNKLTTETCSGVLNLVDLAGSERVKVHITYLFRNRVKSKIHKGLK